MGLLANRNFALKGVLRECKAVLSNGNVREGVFGCMENLMANQKRDTVKGLTNENLAFYNR